MPREPEYESNAARQAAYRERRRRELAEEPVEPVVVLELPADRPCSWTEDEYVAHELAVTRSQLGARLKDPDGRTLERCEAYARWRYRGFRAGLIASL